jgi:S-adenosylmethionine:tRNA ribosyltransferase-isomerase
MLDINLEEYNFSLPQEKIALFPLSNRAESKLLLVNKKNQSISHHCFQEIPDLLPENSTIFLNNSKVIAARLLMKKSSGGLAEILCVEPINPSNDPQIAMSAKGKCTWKCIVGGKRINTGSILSEDTLFNFRATILEKEGQDAIVEFNWDNEKITFSEVIDKLGKVPLPPYIKRDVEAEDKIRYQTVYAEYDGSVAAPTAGLHFTNEILNLIKEKGIGIYELTLHVGTGTFKPIGSNNILNHRMHSELIIVSKSLLANILKSINDSKYIVATGTTSLRTLETLYWVGAKLINKELNYSEGEFELGQWDAYRMDKEIDVKDSIEMIINFLDKNNLSEIRGRTELFVIPGYNFKIVKGLITNYHLPKSTLILLVAAFLGKELWKKVYSKALNNNYRFLSYGDSSLLLS